MWHPELSRRWKDFQHTVLELVNGPLWYVGILPITSSGSVRGQFTLTSYEGEKYINQDSWLDIWWGRLTVYMTSLLFLMAQHSTMLKTIPMIYNKKEFKWLQFHMEVLWRLQSSGFANSHHYSCNPDSNVSNNMKLLIEKVCYCS